MPISMYPPLLKSTQSAFLTSTYPYQVYFQLQEFQTIKDVGHIQIRITRQNDNASIVKASSFPDLAIYLNSDAIHPANDGRQYYVNIERSYLSESWKENQLYKIQTRFGKNAKFTNVSNFAAWKQEQIEQNAFSEWSNTMITKAISVRQPPYIKNAGSLKQGVSLSERLESSLTPLFSGYCESSEPVERYKFSLYQGDLLLETSGWLLHQATTDGLDKHRFKRVMEENVSYVVTYSIITQNGYEAKAKDYRFQCALTYLPRPEGFTMDVDSSSEFCRENGCIVFHFNSDGKVTGNFVLTRTDEKSNYSVYEEVKYFQWISQKVSNERFVDFTIESGVHYKYAFCEENSAGLRSLPVTQTGGDTHLVNFEYSYLYCNGVQLPLKFNQTMNSFKHNVSRQKQDTIGGRYPYIVQNGDMYYAEFPINALISFQMDADQTFFTWKDDAYWENKLVRRGGFYYRDELVIPKEKFHITQQYRGQDAPAAHLINSSFSYDNIFVERMFRKKVENFLNSYDEENEQPDCAAFLYRSPTEGNLVVALANIALQPNDQLGRMIYSFTSTAYEVASHDLLALDKMHIWEIGEYTSLENDTVFQDFGQVGPYYGKTSWSIYKDIKNKEEVSLGGGYKLQLESLSAIQIEAYPYLDLTGEILEQQALKSKAKLNGESTQKYDDEIERLQTLQKALDGMQNTAAMVSINGKEVMIMPNKLYAVNEPITSLSLVRVPYPISVNYVANLTQRQDKSVKIVSAIESARVWGQLAGVFTETDEVLREYDYYYLKTPTFRVFNPRPDSTVKKDKNGNILIDNTTYNVYKTLNLMNIIQQEAKKQVELLYNTKFEEKNGVVTDGTVEYIFDHVAKIDIEADEGTTLLVGKKSDGSDAVEIKIGTAEARYMVSKTLDYQTGYHQSRNRIVIDTQFDHVQYLALKEPAYCIINFVTITNQRIMKEIGG